MRRAVRVFLCMRRPRSASPTLDAAPARTMILRVILLHTTRMIISLERLVIVAR